MIHRKDFWIYGPEGKPIRDNAAKEDCADESSQKSNCVRRPWVYSNSEVPPAPNYGRHAKAPAERKSKKVIEILTAIAVVVGVPVYMFQGCQMVKTNNFYASHLAEFKRQADAAYLQAIIAKGQLEDSESQQRAWLRVEKPEFNKTKDPKDLIKDDYTLSITIPIHNFGLTPAIDIGADGVILTASTEEFEKRMSNMAPGLIAQLPKKWDKATTKLPKPAIGGGNVMPQEIQTNVWTIPALKDGETVHLEWWVSYRTIFRQSGIAGEGGTYNPADNSFVPEFGKFENLGQPQTNH